VSALPKLATMIGGAVLCATLRMRKWPFESYNMRAPDGFNASDTLSKETVCWACSLKL
jgi:hypothetical protein